MTKELTPLSASRIKTFKDCSWKYYIKYEAKLPEKSSSNREGMYKGSILHNIFECLGNPRHKKHYDAIVKEGDFFASKVVERYVYLTTNKFKINTEENIDHIKRMGLRGVKYDFFGRKLARPTEEHSEIKFDIKIDEDGKKYRILGFIDKLFLYKSKKQALIRDFKSSKKVFVGKDVEDNLQDQFYALAVKYLYPEYLKRDVEFLFLNFDLKKKGRLKMSNLSEDELEFFEHVLTELQETVENFTLEDAKSNLAYYKGYPTDGSFSNRLSCGFDEYDGQMKKDGSGLKWGCDFKWPFQYYKVCNAKGEHIGNFRLDEPDEMPYNDAYTYELRQYKGCPAWNKK